ncbi:MAG TPA: helix-turn-helix domain-containing protein [Acidimicrobiales bacterium]|nr:helix-turn-helix domain-containing protein [Acidimicrobiales bacterium]
MHRVVTLVGPRVSMFELAVPCEVFGVDRSDLADPWYRHRVAAFVPGPHTTPEGVVVDTPYGLEQLAEADTVVIPAPSYAGPPPEDLLEALRAAHARGARLLSVCTGAFLLAATGLLDGKRATTHWMYAAELGRRFPLVKVDPKVLYIDEGDVMTSAGTAAGIDLMLHVVRLDHGADVANAVARRMVVPPHRDGGQAQFVDLPMPDPERDEPLAGLLGWMLEHVDEDLSVAQLARRAGMSPRTFARRFRALTGATPHQWLLSQRILLAQRLLETTDEPVERVARRCGFGTAAGLRQHFGRAVSSSPQAYRRAFRG